VLIKACLNGGRSRDEHPTVPITPNEVSAQAREARDAGAGAVHVHPRGKDGLETLDPGPCGDVVAAVREACPGLPIGLTTGLWISPGGPDERLRDVAAWDPSPDFASVNVGEDGWVELAELLIERGIGVEAGLTDPGSAHEFLDSPMADRCLRVLVEVERITPRAPVAVAAEVDVVLDASGIGLPRLHHGYGSETWAVIEAGAARGHDVRVGLEDVLTLPDGLPAVGNADLVAAAVKLVFPER
jgi:uncharacterized protein (DUF849 family)